MSRYSLFVSLIAVFGLGLALSPTTKGQARLPHTFTSTVTVTQTARQTATQTATLTASQPATQTVTQTATQTGVHAGALASTSTGVRIGGLDHNILDLRNSAVPNFHYKYDDYLQYAPAALMLGLKACGVEGQTPWVPMLVADACSAGIMAIAVNGIKYTVGRLRPDGSRYNSFPSGHTATAFLTATLLHKEYGHLSPWYSIGGYTAAAITGVSRILNNRHWLSDVMTGAAIGIGSVHLDYYLTELMFPITEDNTGFETITPPNSTKSIDAGLVFGQKYRLSQRSSTSQRTAALAAIATDVALHPNLGLSARLSTSTTTNQQGLQQPWYTASAGGFYRLHLAERWKLQPYLLAGCYWNSPHEDSSLIALESPSLTSGSGLHLTTGVGLHLTTGIGLHLITGENFKLKLFAELESACDVAQNTWTHFGVIGWSSSWFLSWGS